MGKYLDIVKSFSSSNSLLKEEERIKKQPFQNVIADAKEAKHANDGNEHDSELLASLERLEHAKVLLAIADDGTLRVLRSETEAHTATLDGFTIYTPRDAYMYVTLSEHERRLLHQFKRKFGGTVE